MHPPQHILDKLQEIHPWVRLGWRGSETKGDGRFALLQLYHQKDFLSTYVQPWEKRGPVYGKPYDPLVRFPMWVKDVSIEDVFSGKILEHLREWIRPMSDRIKESEDRAWKDLDFKLSDIAEEAGDYVWHESKKVGKSPGISARKFVSKEQQAILAGDYDRDICKSVVKTPAPAGSVAMK